MKKVSVVIPNYNGEKFIKECMESLDKQTYKDFDVIFVDNGSEDDSVEVAVSSSGNLQVQMIMLDSNYGFSRAVNEGIKASDSEYVILLNNDTKVAKDFVWELLNAIDGNEDIFSAQAKMLKYDDKKLCDDAGDYFCALGWAFARGKDKPARRYRDDVEIFSACAGAAIYRKSVFEEIGYFDENFFAYLEDVDIGYRARLYGYINIFASRAKVLHVGSGSSGTRYNSFKVGLAARNSLYVMYKNFAGWQKVINFLPVVAGIAVKTVFFAKKGLAKEYIKGVFSAFSGVKKLDKPQIPEELHYNYSIIQKELYANIIRRLGEK